MGRPCVRPQERESKKAVFEWGIFGIRQAWLDSKMYAMRDDYCQPTCPDGTTTIITDVQDTSITLKSPSYSKQVFECYTTTDGKPDNPKPPQEYFELARRLVQLAKSNHWL
jgi:hypothetical protein